MNNILDDCLITRVANGAVAGTADVDSSILDMSGWDGVLFIAALGDVLINSVLELHAEQNIINSVSGMAQLNGKVGATAGATDYDNVLLAIDVFKPQERYIRAKLKRGTATAVVDGIVAIQYRGLKAPVVQGATVKLSKFSASPDEGTS